MKHRNYELIELSYLCQWDMPDEIKKFLEQGRSEFLDITYNEG
ncbi:MULTISPECIES: hypothetical protein [unclassified Rickettsia]